MKRTNATKERTNAMWLLALLMPLGLMSSGCESLSASASQTSPHEVVSARQAKAEDVLKPLPEMTAHDYDVLGDQYHQQGNLSLAFVQYDKALRLEPNRSDIRYKKSSILLQRASLTEAVQSFQDILNRDPTYALAYEGLGESYLRLNRLDEAEQSCHKAIALDAVRWRAYNCLGMTYDRKQRFQNAVEAYQHAIKLQPQQAMLLNNLGLSYYAQGRYQDSANILKQSLSLEKDQSRVYNNLGVVLSKLGRYEEALSIFTQGGSKAQAYNNLGVMHMAEGNYQQAISSFEKAIELNPAYYDTAGDNLTLARKALAGARPPDLRAPNLSEQSDGKPR